MAPPDADLMRGVSAGDPSALEALYDRYASRLLGLALRIVQERTAAEDVLQEAFLRVWRRAASFDPKRGEVVGWLAAIVRNAGLDHLRRVGARPPLADIDDEAWPDETPDPAMDVPAAVAERAQAERVRRALAALPREQRQVIELSYFAGLSRREIAARLNVPEGTIHTRARLGLHKLRELLEAA
jgi:RNA polymerase sigma-70 factor (ECF subfamily)